MAMKNMIADPNEYAAELKKDTMQSIQRRTDHESHEANASEHHNLRARASTQGFLCHSDEEKSAHGGSNTSSTLARYSRRARRTSSCHQFGQESDDNQNDSIDEEEE